MGLALIAGERRALASRDVAVDVVRQAEIAAQRGALVFAAEAAAPAQLGYDQLDEILRTVRQVRWREVEAVGCLLVDPLLQHVGDILGRALQQQAAAAGRLLLIELPD